VRALDLTCAAITETETQVFPVKRHAYV